jgi:hypothetical protein
MNVVAASSNAAHGVLAATTFIDALPAVSRGSIAISPHVPLVPPSRLTVLRL